jgi:hypothetical protein
LIRDLSTRDLEFFRRFLRENADAAEEWAYEGYCDLGGRFGLWGILNPSHPFQG